MREQTSRLSKYGVLLWDISCLLQSSVLDHHQPSHHPSEPVSPSSTQQRLSTVTRQLNPEEREWTLSPIRPRPDQWTENQLIISKVKISISTSTHLFQTSVYIQSQTESAKLTVSTQLSLGSLTNNALVPLAGL
jgi:hypothetical protein